MSLPNFDPLNQLPPELRDRLNEAINTPTHFLDIKDSCRAATTAAITLSGLQTVDGVVLRDLDRVLVKNQVAGPTNGLYSASAGPWIRTEDANDSISVTSGLFTLIEEGTLNAQQGYVLNTANPIVLGVTSLSFTQFTGVGDITAGDGLSKVGNTLLVDTSVVRTSRTITAGTGLSGGGDLSSNRTVSMPNVGAPAVYANPSSVTTDAQGRVSAITAGPTPAIATRNLAAGAGLTGGGDLSADRTFNVVGNGDGSIVVNADDIQVGTLGFSRVQTALAGASSTIGVNNQKLSNVLDPTLAQDAATKNYVDLQAAGEVPAARTITAGAGLTGGGDLTVNRTIDVIANGDGSIVVNANDIQVGTLGFARVQTALAVASSSVSMNDQAITGLSIDRTNVGVFTVGGTLATNILLKSADVDSASAVASTIDTNNPFANAGAKLLSIKNAGVEKMYINKDGELIGNNDLVLRSSTAGTTFIDINNGNIQEFIAGTAATLTNSTEFRPVNNLGLTLGTPSQMWSQAWSVNYAGLETTLASTATPEWNPAGSGDTVRMVLTANVTSWTIASGLQGQRKRLRWIQDGTGGWTVAGPPANVILSNSFAGGQPANANVVADLGWDNTQSKWVEIAYRAVATQSLDGYMSAADKARVTGIAFAVSTIKTSAYSAVIGDLVRVNPTAGGFTVTLPAISATNLGQHITIKNTSSSANTITIATTGGNTVDGAATASLSGAFGALDFVSDGSGNWMVL